MYWLHADYILLFICKDHGVIKRKAATASLTLCFVKKVEISVSILLKIVETKN